MEIGNDLDMGGKIKTTESGEDEREAREASHRSGERKKQKKKSAQERGRRFSNYTSVRFFLGAAAISRKGDG